MPVGSKLQQYSDLTDHVNTAPTLIKRAHSLLVPENPLPSQYPLMIRYNSCDFTTIKLYCKTTKSNIHRDRLCTKNLPVACNTEYHSTSTLTGLFVVLLPILCCHGSSATSGTFLNPLYKIYSIQGFLLLLPFVLFPGLLALLPSQYLFWTGTEQSNGGAKCTYVCMFMVSISH